MHKLKKYKSLLLFLAAAVLALYLSGCGRQEKNVFRFSHGGGETVISLVKAGGNAFDIKAETLLNGEKIVSAWHLDYPVFRFDCADITGDGIPEIAVGVIKPARFDPETKKRLFLFKLYDSLYVRPLWLGSRMPLPLEDFELSGGKIITLERESENVFAAAEYEYKVSAFGPKLVRYIKKGVSRKEAVSAFTKNLR
jgi:hypothetical protein